MKMKQYFNSVCNHFFEAVKKYVENIHEILHSDEDTWFMLKLKYWHSV